MFLKPLFFIRFKSKVGTLVYLLAGNIYTSSQNLDFDLNKKMTILGTKVTKLEC